MNYIKISYTTYLFLMLESWNRSHVLDNLNKYIPENFHISIILQTFSSSILAKETSKYFWWTLIIFIQTFIRLIKFIAYYIKNSIYTTKPSKLSIYDMNNFGQEIFSSFCVHLDKGFRFVGFCNFILNEKRQPICVMTLLF